MTQTVKKAMEVMRRLNPYDNNEPATTVEYNKIWSALYTLYNIGALSHEEWNAVFNLDNKLFNDAE